jgi:hypothetical protein
VAALTRDNLIHRRVASVMSLDVEGVGIIRIRELTMGEAKELAALAGKNEDATRYVLYRCMVDDAGQSILSGPDDMDAINALGTGTMKRIVETALEFSGMKSKGDDVPNS